MNGVLLRHHGERQARKVVVAGVGGPGKEARAFVSTLIEKQHHVAGKHCLEEKTRYTGCIERNIDNIKHRHCDDEYQALYRCIVSAVAADGGK